ncbi:transcriptional regulator [Tenacibaculum sp. KUL152]|nr:transcriptional regulator [Tenacibaculum sp. KUL152]
MSRNTTSPLSHRIATRLRDLRKVRGLSLDKAATLTGVSKAMLGQIERGESSPTIATLWKISAGLATSFSSFLASENSEATPTNGTDADRFVNDPNMQVKTLFGYNATTGFEMFELRLSDCHEQHSPPHQVGVTEYIHVTKGRLSILQDGCWKTYEEGMQCLLHADQPHGYRDEVGETHFIAVIHYPS